MCITQIACQDKTRSGSVQRFLKLHYALLVLFFVFRHAKHQAHLKHREPFREMKQIARQIRTLWVLAKSFSITVSPESTYDDLTAPYRTVIELSNRVSYDDTSNCHKRGDGWFRWGTKQLDCNINVVPHNKLGWDTVCVVSASDLRVQIKIFVSAMWKLFLSVLFQHVKICRCKLINQLQVLYTCQPEWLTACLTLWPQNWTFKQQNIIYVKCEYFTNQKR